MGDARADDDGAARAILAAADARTISAACCGLDGAALDADGAADGAIIAAADACAVRAARGGDVGRAADGDVAAGGFVSAADARAFATALGRDVGSAVDADVAAGGIGSAADARTATTARGGDGPALDDDVSASNIFGPADARAIAICRATARGRERARALDGERFTLGNKDAGIILIETLYHIGSAVGQDDGGIARAGKARPFKAVVVVALDVHAFEYYRRTVSNGDF